MKRLILTSSSGFGLHRCGPRRPCRSTSAFASRGGSCRPRTNFRPISERVRTNRVRGITGRTMPAVGPADDEERQDLSLVEFCEAYDAIELWFDPHPNDQLQLIWLLDYFRFHPKTAAKLVFRLVDFDLLGAREEELRRFEVFDLPRYGGGIEYGKPELAGISFADAGSLLRSAFQQSKRLADAETGPGRTARRAAFQCRPASARPKCGYWR